MPLSDEDKALIKNLDQSKKYGPQRILAEFSEENWKMKRLGTSVKRTGNRKHGPQA